MTSKTQSADPRDAFVTEYAKRVPVKADAQVVEDIRYFAARAAEGKEISITGMINFFREQRGMELKRYRLATIAKEHGIEPWWST